MAEPRHKFGYKITYIEILFYYKNIKIRYVALRYILLFVSCYAPGQCDFNTKFLSEINDPINYFIS